MKQQTHYELWICYGKNKWHSLKRTAPTLGRAEHIMKEIAKEHKPSTKIVVVEVKTSKDSITAHYGTKTFLEPNKLKYCNQCGKKRFRRNINPKTGTCLTCEMRNKVELVDLNLQDYKGGDI